MPAGFLAVVIGCSMAMNSGDLVVAGVIVAVAGAFLIAWAGAKKEARSRAKDARIKELRQELETLTKRMEAHE